MNPRFDHMVRFFAVFSLCAGCQPPGKPPAPTLNLSRRKCMTSPRFTTELRGLPRSGRKGQRRPCLGEPGLSGHRQ